MFQPIYCSKKIDKTRSKSQNESNCKSMLSTFVDKIRGDTRRFGQASTPLNVLLNGKKMCDVTYHSVNKTTIIPEERDQAPDLK